MHFSTFSIVAHDPADKSFGVVVASKFLAVGAYVPYAEADAGAIATQAHANLSYGPSGLAMLASGMSAADVIEKLTGDDDGRDHRQLGIVDLSSNAATYTGSKCMDWAGGVTGKNFAAQGNILAGPHVVQAMASAYESASGELADRLYAALSAGDAAGGDRRGKQAAALLVVKPGGGYGEYNDRYLDLRVDDHAEPVKQLGELLKLHRLYFGKTAAQDKIKLDAALVRELQRAATRLGYFTGEINGALDETTRRALDAFIGTENLEERVDLINDTIDPPALEYIRVRFTGGQASTSSK
jgi:uncharacterized Ntn-hydrolase superfamily protein